SPLLNSADLDWYIVRGVPVTLRQQVLLGAAPAVKVYANDTPIQLDVYKLNADNTQGDLWGSASGGSCTKTPAAVPLEEDAYYLVKVTGQPGRYTLQNGIVSGGSHIPLLVHDRVYDVLHPGDPVEHVLKVPEIY